MLTFFKLLFKFLELWRGVAEGTLMADKVLDSIDEMKAEVESLIEKLEKSV